ncbi:MAG TPA: acyl-CoA dehydrogenase [Paraburkholderia sp.]|nr:acyl-CoA dehydrogenase [Paraburkholderia sp.]
MKPDLPPAVHTIVADDDCLCHVERLLDTLALPVDGTSIAAASRTLTRALPSLPPPGEGDTLLRWRMLAAIAARDLSLVKIYEAHADAAAILAELGAAAPRRGSVWAVWAAQMPDAPLRISRHADDLVRLNGLKSWCSGAAFATDALVTCIDDDDRPWLAAVDLAQPGVEAVAGTWHAVGMAATGSVDVRFTEASARLVGRANAYLERPGFWFGAAGIAACWYGAAAALATRLADAAAHRDDPHRRAHLGAADAALSAARALLRETANDIDRAKGTGATRGSMGASTTAAMTGSMGGSTTGAMTGVMTGSMTGASADAMTGATTDATAGATAHAIPNATAHAPFDPTTAALRVRAAVEEAVDAVLRAVSRGLGAAPFCRDRWFARMAADLPVFVRQSHAEHDLATLGGTLAARAGTTERETWRL